MSEITMISALIKRGIRLAFDYAAPGTLRLVASYTGMPEYVYTVPSELGAAALVVKAWHDFGAGSL